MKDTVGDFQLHRREAQPATANRIHSSKSIGPVARSALVPAWSGCAAAVAPREDASAGDTLVPSTSLWRLSLAAGASDRVESVASLLLAVGSAVSLLDGFWRLDYFLARWPSFVELVQKVFS